MGNNNDPRKSFDSRGSNDNRDYATSIDNGGNQRKSFENPKSLMGNGGQQAPNRFNSGQNMHNSAPPKPKPLPQYNSINNNNNSGQSIANKYNSDRNVENQRPDNKFNNNSNRSSSNQPDISNRRPENNGTNIIRPSVASSNNNDPRKSFDSRVSNDNRDYTTSLDFLVLYFLFYIF